MSKKVLVSKVDNSVKFVGNVADVTPEGIDVGGIIFPGVDYIDIVTMPDDHVPVGPLVSKYCYSTAAGFYLNPNYTPGVSEELAAMRQQLAQISSDFQSFMDYVLSGGGE